MDYEAEQEMEIEALEAILMDDLKAFEGPLPDGWPSGTHCRMIAVRPESSEASTSDPVTCDFVYAYMPTYPDEPPLYTVQGQDKAKLLAVLDEQVEANLGMAMIYAMVAAMQEYLQGLAHEEGEVGGLDPKQAKARAAEEEEARAAAKRSLGTAVTPQTFAAWRQRFVAETALLQAKLDASEKLASAGPTGRQWFQSQEATGQVLDESEEEVESGEEDFDEGADLEDEDEDDDDDDLLDNYLAAKQ